MTKREWATTAYEALSNGLPIQVRPRGHSMAGLVSDGDLVTLEPYRGAVPAVGDVVLARVSGRRFVHLVLSREAGRVLVGNAQGRADGWVSVGDVYGKVTRVEPTSVAEPPAA